VTGPRRAGWGAFAALFGGLVLVSTSGPFLALAKLDALAVSGLRCLFAGLLFALGAALRGNLRAPRGHGRALLGGGVLLAAHFALWVKAFDLTDYASNLLLLVAQPISAALVGLALGDRPRGATVVSLALAVAGLFVIAGGDLGLGPRALLGDAACIAAAFAMTFFTVATRTARAELPIELFLASVFLVAAAVLLPSAALAGDRLLPTTPASWGWLTALVLATTIGGHGLMNLAARSVKLFTLNVVIVLEPPIGIALGALLFGAGLTVPQALGGAILAAAVLFGLQGERAPLTRR